MVQQRHYRLRLELPVDVQLVEYSLLGALPAGALPDDLAGVLFLGLATLDEKHIGAASSAKGSSDCVGLSKGVRLLLGCC